MDLLSTSNEFADRLRSCIGNDITDTAEEVASYFFPCQETPKSNLLRALTLAGTKVLGQAVGRESGGTAANQTQSEIKRVLRRFMSNQDELFDAIGDSVSEGNSCDLTIRVVRLQRILEEIFGESDMSAAASIFSSCSRTKMNMLRSKEATAEAEIEVKQMIEKMESMRIENNDLHRTIDNLRASHSKNVARTKALAEANAMDTQQLLADEKKLAEDQARQYQRRMVEAEEKCSEANARAEDARRDFEQAKAAISELSQRFEALEIQAQDEAERKNAAEEELQEIRQDLESMERELQEKADDLSDLEKEQHAARDALRVAESSNDELRQEMETTYARLVSLAQLFQVKEDDLSKASSTHRDAIRRAHKEADDLSRKRAVAEERADAFESENKELKRKLAKAMKDLDKEKSSKATGPVGYFNRLHDDYDQRHGGDRERPRYGKENERESSRSRPSSRTRDGSQRRFHIAR